MQEGLTISAVMAALPCALLQTASVVSGWPDDLTVFGWEIANQLVSRCGCTSNCLGRSFPEIHSARCRTLSNQQTIIRSNHNGTHTNSSLLLNRANNQLVRQLGYRSECTWQLASQRYPGMEREVVIASQDKLASCMLRWHLSPGQPPGCKQLFHLSPFT